MVEFRKKIEFYDIYKSVLRLITQNPHARIDGVPTYLAQ